MHTFLIKFIFTLVLFKGGIYAKQMSGRRPSARGGTISRGVLYASRYSIIYKSIELHSLYKNLGII